VNVPLAQLPQKTPVGFIPAAVFGDAADDGVAATAIKPINITTP
jgi:hypothetical protein